jgi:hypothetical protein
MLLSRSQNSKTAKTQDRELVWWVSATAAWNGLFDCLCPYRPQPGEACLVLMVYTSHMCGRSEKV